MVLLTPDNLNASNLFLFTLQVHRKRLQCSKQNTDIFDRTIFRVCDNIPDRKLVTYIKTMTSNTDLCFKAVRINDTQLYEL